MLMFFSRCRKSIHLYLNTRHKSRNYLVFPKIRLFFVLCFTIQRNAKQHETMTRKSIHILLTLLTSLLYLTTASAQRTMSGQKSLRVSLLYNGLSVGAEAFYEPYTLTGFWQAGVQGNLYKAGLSTAHSLDYVHALAQGGYQFRLAGTRSRSLNLYAGGGALVGVEILDAWRRLPYYLDLGKSRYAFIYGLYSSAMLEWFVSRQWALVLHAGLPVTFGSAIGALHWNVGIGLKWNL